MNYKKTYFLLLACPCALVNAQDLRFGLQATISRPQGDMGDSKSLDGELGYGIGLQVPMDFKNGVVLVPRLDYLTYKHSVSITTHYPVVDLTLNTNLKASILHIGADFNYYINKTSNKGFFFLAGLGYSSGSFVTALSGQVPNQYGNIVSANGYDSTSAGAFYIATGFGINFNQNIGTELRYIGLNKYTKNGQDMTGPSLNVSIVVRF